MKKQLTFLKTQYHERTAPHPEELTTVETNLIEDTEQWTNSKAVEKTLTTRQKRQLWQRKNSNQCKIFSKEGNVLNFELNRWLLPLHTYR